MGERPACRRGGGTLRIHGVLKKGDLLRPPERRDYYPGDEHGIWLKTWKSRGLQKNSDWLRESEHSFGKGMAFYPIFTLWRQGRIIKEKRNEVL